MNLQQKLPRQTPWIEGDQATFVWHGPKPPNLIGDFNNWDPQTAIRLKKGGPGLWTSTRTFPTDAYIEYVYLLDGERQTDPANPHTVFNGIDADNNYFYMPGAEPTPLARRRPGLPRGRLVRETIERTFSVVGGKRRVTFYQPPVDDACPLLVVFDGDDYLRRARLAVIVENLIQVGRIRPVALAMLANGGQARIIEYAQNDMTLEFILEGVLPAARQQLNLVSPEEAPGAYGVLGASMGGLMAFYTGFRLPHIFGRVLSQSGAFSEHFTICDLVRLKDPAPVKVWIDNGRFDFLYEDNRQMADLLESKGYEVSYHEYSGGHNYTAWANVLACGLEALFGAEAVQPGDFGR